MSIDFEYDWDHTWFDCSSNENYERLNEFLPREYCPAAGGTPSQGTTRFIVKANIYLTRRRHIVLTFAVE